MSRSSADIVFKGNIPDNVKTTIRNLADWRPQDGIPIFAFDIRSRLCPKEMELFERGKDGKVHARAVYELKVESGASLLRRIDA